MTLDIVLLIATIAVAVLAVIVGLIRAVLERRRGPRWEQYRSRRIDPQRLERAVPGPTAKDGTIRELEKQAPAMGSRPGFAALGAPVAVELIGDMPGSADDELGPADASPAHPYAYAYARESDAPDAEPESESAATEPIATVVVPEVQREPEADSAATEPIATDDETAQETALSDAAMAELGIATKRGHAAAMPAAVAPTPVDWIAEPGESAEAAAVSATPVEWSTEATEPAEPAVAAVEPVPLFLPGTYTVGAADNEEPAVKREDAPAPAARAAAMTAGYAPTARAVFVPPPPDVIEEELAYRIGVRGARRPEPPAVMEVAGGPEALAPVLPTVETEAWPERRSRRRRRAAIGMTVIAAAVVLAIGATTLPNLLEQGGVLGDTGRPPTSVVGDVPLETTTPTLPPATSQPTTSPPPQASPSPAATPVSAAPSTSPSPSPAASAAASSSIETASVTPRPTSNTIRPPIARFDCTSEGLVLTCDGSKSSGATDYLWDFGEGSTVPGVTSSHAYNASGSYLVTLTVTGQSGSTSRSQSFIVP